jgi:hypothetical protein
LRKSVLAREVLTEACSGSWSAPLLWVLLPFMVVAVVVEDGGGSGLSGEAAIKMLDLFDGGALLGGLMSVRI